MADINEIISPKAIEDILRLNDALAQTALGLEKLVLASKEAEKQDKSSGKNKEKLTTAQQQALKTNKAVEASIAKTNQIRSKQNKILIENRKVVAEQTRLIKTSVTAAKALDGSYEKISATLSKNLIAWKKLSAAERENSSAGKKLTADIKKQEAGLKRLDRQIGKNQRNVGNYASALRNLLGAFGLFVGARAFIQVLQQAIKTGIEFERTMSTVKAVSGATASEMLQLKNNAKLLGETTEKTASEVGQLEVNLAKLGLTAPQIIAATGAILDLSTAAGEDLAEAATITAGTIKAFNLQADQAGKVADIMAKSFASSALDLNKFKDSMSKVGPVAKNAGQSIEKTTAQLSVLVDRNVDASTAGTGLRGILLDLSRHGLTLEEAFKKINSATNKNKVAFELFGKRGATVAVILAENQKQTDLLTKSYENSAGAAARMAAIMRDNLRGDLDRAKSASEGLAINITTRLTPSLRHIVRGFTSFVGKLNEFVRIPASEELAMEQVQLNILVGTITQANVEQETRNRLLTELEDKYPEFLKNLDTETVTNKELTTQLKAVNEQFDERIKLMVAEEILRQTLEEQAELYVRQSTLMKSITFQQAEVDEWNQAIKDGTAEIGSEFEDAFTKQEQLDSFTNSLEGVNTELEKIQQTARDAIANVTGLGGAVPGGDGGDGGGAGVDIVAIWQKNLEELLKIQKKQDDLEALARREDIKDFGDLRDLEVEIEKEMAAELKKIDKEITAARKLELDQQEKDRKDKTEAEIEAEFIKQEAIRAVIAGSTEVLFALNDTLFSAKIAQIDEEFFKLQQRKDQELALAGDNAELRARIEEDFAKKENQLRQEQAIAQKKAGLFNAIINTAGAIISAALTQPFIPLGLIAVGIATALGALQVAAISSQPIPQFFKGTESAPGGAAWVGEKGKELFKTRSGKVGITPGVSTLMNMPKGTQIIPNAETELLLRMGKAGYDSKELQSLESAIRDGDKKIVRAIRNKRELTVNRKKNTITERKGNYFKTYLNRKVYD